MCLELSFGDVAVGRPSLNSRLRASRCDHLSRWCLVPGHDDRGTRPAWRFIAGCMNWGIVGNFKVWGTRMSTWNWRSAATEVQLVCQVHHTCRFGVCKMYLISACSMIRSSGCPLIRASCVVARYPSAIRPPQPMDHAALALGLDFVRSTTAMRAVAGVLKHQWRRWIPVAW
jgi:hypothetical protein